MFRETVFFPDTVYIIVLGHDGLAGLFWNCRLDDGG